MSKPPENTREISALVEIVAALRGENGCPWDKEQTHESLAPFAIEETFELVEAIEQGSAEGLKEELGDCLFQVVLHSQLAQEENKFSLSDVIESISQKMVRRHPHVFSDVKVQDSSEVIKNWQQIKAQEKDASKKKSSPLETPKGLPALMEAQKIGHKTKNLGFDWQEASQVFAKVKEEVSEVEDALHNFSENSSSENLEALSKEIGDALFSLAQLARHLKLDSEKSLRTTNHRFRSRFSEMLTHTNKDLEQFKNLSPEEKEALWEKAKKIHR
ncbi:MAG: nucleoside triphosphate pyrophosphohydrolase [Bdellovibrionaceae bacterium]|nr:nucleoside triphosphate pyrophosphohydrolase [Pseudobdellovibrionaceae bacterium]|tara:strand:- start:7775 stop:8593 length:819 start_codon:yes stop_codon:yes gene_type:complete